MWCALKQRIMRRTRARPQAIRQQVFSDLLRGDLLLAFFLGTAGLVEPLPTEESGATKDQKNDPESWLAEERTVFLLGFVLHCGCRRRRRWSRFRRRRRDLGCCQLFGFL